MSDLISREALMEYARNHVGHTIDCNDIARFPAVDAEPVRHGCWFPYRVAGEPLLRFQCSACHHWVDGGTDRNYCPNCGAKMDGGAGDDHQGT